MRLLGAFLRLLVAGALGAPPAPVRSGGGAGGGSERGQPGGSPAPPVPPPGVAVAAGAAPPGAGWRGARRRVPPCRPRQRPPFPPCRPRRRGGPPARSRPVSWQRAAAGAPAGRGRQPGEGCAQGRGRGELGAPRAVILPGVPWRCRGGAGARSSLFPHSPPRALAGTRSGAQPWPGLAAPPVPGCGVPGRSTPLRLPSARTGGKPEGTVVRCACGAGLLRPPKEGGGAGEAPPRRGAGGGGVPGQERGCRAGGGRAHRGDVVAV